MCNVSQSRDLLLFSYMRSGSSLTAELIRDSPNTFFVFEPLIPLAPYHYFTDESVCNMRDVKCRYVLIQTLKIVSLAYTMNSKAFRISSLNTLLCVGVNKAKLYLDSGSGNAILDIRNILPSFILYNSTNFELRIASLINMFPTAAL